jgi:lactose/L-arabinose transport system substrate-binding protein
MRIKLVGVATAVIAGLSVSLGAARAADLSGEITVWSWNTAASSLKATVPGFNKLYPNVKVNVLDIGNPATIDTALAGCAAGGVGLPDVLSIDNQRTEIFWNQFPDCFVDLHTLGYTAADQAKFPMFKRIELEGCDKAYAMPWDSGPVAMFYRRDFYQAGVDPTAIKTWDDFIAAGKKVAAANPGVVMSQADFNGDTEYFQMMSNEQGCNTFSADGKSITVNQPGCVRAFAKLKEMKDAGTLTAANWGEKIQTVTAGKVASEMYGGWYEGSIRTNAPADAGKWGVYLMAARLSTTSSRRTAASRWCSSPMRSIRT